MSPNHRGKAHIQRTRCSLRFLIVDPKKHCLELRVQGLGFGVQALNPKPKGLNPEPFLHPACTNHTSQTKGSQYYPPRLSPMSSSLAPQRILGECICNPLQPLNTKPFVFLGLSRHHPRLQPGVCQIRTPPKARKPKRDSGLGVQGLGLKVQGLGFGVWGLGFLV